MCVCTHMCVWRAEDNLQELILPNMWGLSIRLRVLRLGGKSFTH